MNIYGYLQGNKKETKYLKKKRIERYRVTSHIPVTVAEQRHTATIEGEGRKSYACKPSETPIIALSYWPIRKRSIMSGLFAKGWLNHGGVQRWDLRAVSHGTPRRAFQKR